MKSEIEYKVAEKIIADCIKFCLDEGSYGEKALQISDAKFRSGLEISEMALLIREGMPQIRLKLMFINAMSSFLLDEMS